MSELARFWSEEANQTCADCGHDVVTSLSLALGVFLCTGCAKLHQSELQPCARQVCRRDAEVPARAVLLLQAHLARWNNRRTNGFWQAVLLDAASPEHLPQGYSQPQSSDTPRAKAAWILAKYHSRLFCPSIFSGEGEIWIAGKKRRAHLSVDVRKGLLRFAGIDVLLNSDTSIKYNLKKRRCLVKCASLSTYSFWVGDDTVQWFLLLSQIAGTSPLDNLIGATSRKLSPRLRSSPSPRRDGTPRRRSGLTKARSIGSTSIMRTANLLVPIPSPLLGSGFDRKGFLQLFSSSQPLPDITRLAELRSTVVDALADCSGHRYEGAIQAIMLYLPKLNQIVTTLNATLPGDRAESLVKLSQKLERKKVRFAWSSPIDSEAESSRGVRLGRSLSSPTVKKPQSTSSVESPTAVPSLQFEWVMLVMSLGILHLNWANELAQNPVSDLSEVETMYTRAAGMFDLAAEHSLPVYALRKDGSPISHCIEATPEYAKSLSSITLAAAQIHRLYSMELLDDEPNAESTRSDAPCRAPSALVRSVSYPSSSKTDLNHDSGGSAQSATKPTEATPEVALGEDASAGAATPSSSTPESQAPVPGHKNYTAWQRWVGACNLIRESGNKLQQLLGCTHPLSVYVAYAQATTAAHALYHFSQCMVNAGAYKRQIKLCNEAQRLASHAIALLEFSSPTAEARSKQAVLERRLRLLLDRIRAGNSAAVQAAQQAGLSPQVSSGEQQEGRDGVTWRSFLVEIKEVGAPAPEDLLRRADSTDLDSLDRRHGTLIIASVPFRVTPVRKPLQIRPDLAQWAGLSSSHGGKGALSPRLGAQQRQSTSRLAGMGASQGPLSDLLSLAGEGKGTLLEDVMLSYRGLLGHHEFFSELSRVVAQLFADGIQRGATTPRGKRDITSASLLLGAWIDHHGGAVLTDHALKVTVLDFLLGLGRPGTSFKVRLLSRIHTAHEQDEDRSLVRNLLDSVRAQQRDRDEEDQVSTAAIAGATGGASGGGTAASPQTPSLSFFSPLLPRFSAGAVAHTLTTLARQLFACITADELLLVEDGVAVSPSSQPALYACSVLFNRVSAWVSNELIAPCNADSRNKALRTLLKVTRRLYVLHNFEILLAMVAALQGPASTQLKLAWATINKTARNSFLDHCKLLSPDCNWQLYRAHLVKNHDQPYVPCISLLLKDFMTLNLATPKWYRERPGQQEVNFDWVRFVGERLRYVSTRQEMLNSTRKSLTSDSIIEECFLFRMQNMEMDGDALYEAARTCEESSAHKMMSPVVSFNELGVSETLSIAPTALDLLERLGGAQLKTCMEAVLDQCPDAREQFQRTLEEQSSTSLAQLTAVDARHRRQRSRSLPSSFAYSSGSESGSGSGSRIRMMMARQTTSPLREHVSVNHADNSLSSISSDSTGSISSSGEEQEQEQEQEQESIATSTKPLTTHKPQP